MFRRVQNEQRTAMKGDRGRQGTVLCPLPGGDKEPSPVSPRAALHVHALQGGVYCNDMSHGEWFHSVYYLQFVRFLPFLPALRVFRAFGVFPGFASDRAAAGFLYINARAKLIPIL